MAEIYNINNRAMLTYLPSIKYIKGVMDRPRTVDLGRSSTRPRADKKYYKCDPLGAKWTSPKSGLGWLGVVIFVIILILIIFAIFRTIRQGKVIHPITFVWLMLISITVLEYFYKNIATRAVGGILAMILIINFLLLIIFLFWLLWKKRRAGVDKLEIRDGQIIVS